MATFESIINSNQILKKYEDVLASQYKGGGTIPLSDEEDATTA